MQGIVGDDGNRIALGRFNGQDADRGINRARGADGLGILIAGVHAGGAVLHVPAAVEDLRRAGAGGGAEAGGLETELGQADGIGDTEGGPVNIGVIAVGAKEAGGRGAGVRVGAGDEDVLGWKSAQLLHAVLGAVHVVLGQGDDVAEAQREGRVAVVEDHGLGLQGVVNILGESLGEVPGQFGAQERGDIGHCSAGLQFAHVNRASNTLEVVS